MDTRKSILKKAIMVLEWDKSHSQLNPGRKTLLEGYVKELAIIEGDDE